MLNHGSRYDSCLLFCLVKVSLTIQHNNLRETKMGLFGSSSPFDPLLEKATNESNTAEGSGVPFLGTYLEN